MNKLYIKRVANKLKKTPSTSHKKVVADLPNILLGDEELTKYFVEVILTNPELFHSVREIALNSPSFNDRLREINIEDSQIGLDNKIQREIWLEKTLQSIENGKRILDAGAGELQYKRFCKHLDYVSQDFAQFDPSKLKEGNQPESWDNTRLDIISDIINIPVEDESFDALMCVEVFEHLPEPALAVREFARILKGQGKLIITAPFASLTHFAPYFFANGYSKYWYEKILTEAGFEIIEILPNGNYFDYIAQELRRIDSVASKYANDGLDLRENMLIKYLLLTLSKFSKEGSSSSELLTFGYHIFARKI